MCCIPLYSITIHSSQRLVLSPSYPQTGNPIHILQKHSVAFLHRVKVTPCFLVADGLFKVIHAFFRVFIIVANALQQSLLLLLIRGNNNIAHRYANIIKSIGNITQFINRHGIELVHFRIQFAHVPHIAYADIANCSG